MLHCEWVGDDNPVIPMAPHQMQHPGPVYTHDHAMPPSGSSLTCNIPNPLSWSSVAPTVHQCWAIHCWCWGVIVVVLIIPVIVLIPSSSSSASSSLSLFSSLLSLLPSSSATHQHPCPCLVGILSFGPLSPISLFSLSCCCFPLIVLFLFLPSLPSASLLGCCLWCGGVVAINWPFYCGPLFLQVVAHSGSCCCGGGGIISMNLFLGHHIVVMQLDPLY